MTQPMILENCTQMNLTQRQVDKLLSLDLIYDSGDNYYHIVPDKSWDDIDAVL